MSLAPANSAPPTADVIEEAVRRSFEQGGRTLPPMLRAVQALPGYDHDDDDLRTIAVRCINAALENAAEPQPDGWERGNIVELGSTPTPAPDVLPCGGRPGLFYRAQRNMLSGEPSVGKTWLALQAAILEIASGRVVIWIDADNMGPNRLLERLRQLGRAHGVDDAVLAERFRYVRPDARATEATLDALTEPGVSLVVLDSLNPILGLQGVDPYSTTEVDSFFRAVCDPLTDAGACVLMLDHVPKNTGNRGRYAYGSERKLSGVDVHLTMRSHKPFSREQGGESYLDVAKDRDAHVGAVGEVVGAFALEVGDSLTASLREVTASEAELTKSIVAERIAAALADGEGRSQTWIENEVAGARATTKREALDLLQAHGHVAVSRREGRGGGKVYTLIQPYTLTEDGPLGEPE